MPQPQGTSRLTLDLNREQHRRLKSWAQQAAETVGLVDVPMAVVLRWLVTLLTMEPDDPQYDLLTRELQRAALIHLQADRQP